MNRLLPWLPGLLLLAGAAPQDDIKTELAKLEGTWATLYVEIDGKELKADVKNDRLVITGTAFTFTGTSNMEGTLKIDPGKKPRTIDTETTAGEHKGTKMVGIYETDGKRLMVCYRAAPGARPTEFSTSDKSDRILVIYKRVK